MSRRLPRRLRRRPAVLALAVPLLAAGLCGPPQAVASPSAANGPREAARAPASLTLSVAARPGDPARLALTSRLRGALGDGEGTVAFFVVSREFKSPLNVPIGSAEMAANGAARLIYTPTWSGRQQFLAKLTGSDAHVPPATAYYNVTASTPGPLFAGANPTRRFHASGTVFMNVIRTLVALIWLSLIAILVTVRARLPRLARERVD